MCGISGYCLNNPIPASTEALEHLLKPIRKRGPDDEGLCLISREHNKHQLLAHIQPSQMLHDIAFLHTRYAILDLSSKGHQPFVSQDGSVIAIFNGEIYNYLELRQELIALGVVFQTQCDTEVLVEGYAKWKDSLWGRMNGFWAVVLYDHRNQSLVLCRDRMGVAPLYYRETSKGVFFSSYIEPLIELDQQKASHNQEAITGFLQTGFKDLQGSTFYTEIKTVPAATAIHLSPSQSLVSQGEQRPFWFLPDSRLGEGEISFDEAVGQFRNIFFNAVEIRLRADVKLAFELSGGLDSSSVVAAAASMSTQSVTTYTAKIKNADEEPYARAMLQKYKLDYHVLDNIENDFVKDYVAFTQLMEEPYDNPNAYTHYRMLKHMKSEGIKVVVTGAGGDEVFAGYEAAFWPKAYQEWRQQGMLDFMRADWYEFCRRFKTPTKALAMLKHYFLGPFQRMASSSNITENSLTAALRYKNQYERMSFQEQRRSHFLTALLPYYMRSSDHFTMGIPIEHRFPLLDYRLVELGMQLPISYVFRNGWTKYVLRKAMEPYLPKDIVWRRQKMGFQFPFKPYLSTHTDIFEPVFKKFFSDHSYQYMLQQDPIMLWRYICTAIWMEHP